MPRNFGYSKNGGRPKLTITIETELLGESDVELFKNDDRIDAQADYVIEVIRNTPNIGIHINWQVDGIKAKLFNLLSGITGVR